MTYAYINLGQACSYKFIEDVYFHVEVIKLCNDRIALLGS